ncbi:YceD family protein [Muricoccus radiodurans]|uniref:YceD family protein n=1 Tax=Muricoccus radiodurans TaxID=2231721 RepID=UPI003CF8B4F7
MIREFRRMLAPGAVGPEGRTERLEATEAERAALAERLGLLGLDSLTAEIALKPAPGGTLRARGVLRAELSQACVVTLEPVPQRVEEQIDWRILPPGEEPSDELEEGPEEIESEPDGSVDLGEEVAQGLSLALDPYPRAPDAVLPEEAGDPGTASPFAALGRLRRE